MNENADDVVIRRVAGGVQTPNKQPEKSSTTPSKQPKASAVQKEIRQSKQEKAFALLMLLFAILLFIALISYTRRDEANTEISFFDLFGLLFGDDSVIIKAETTYNWLGLLGAYIANFLYNSTIGYSIIFLPLIIIIWAKNIYQRSGIPDKLIKSAGIYLSLATLVASFIGALQQISWMFEIPKEWSGAVGQFVSYFLVNIIGTVGAVIVLAGAIAAVLIFGTNLNLKRIIASIKSSFSNLINKSKNFNFGKRTKVEPKNEENSTEAPNISTVKEPKPTEIKDEKEIKEPIINITKPRTDETPEPARLIRKAAAPSINDIFLPKIPKYPVNITNSNLELNPEWQNDNAKDDIQQKSSEAKESKDIKAKIDNEQTGDELKKTYLQKSNAESNALKETIYEENNSVVDLQKENADKTLNIIGKSESLTSDLSQEAIEAKAIENIDSPGDESEKMQQRQIEPTKSPVANGSAHSEKKQLVVNLYERTPEQTARSPIASWTLDEEINYEPPHLELLTSEGSINEIDEGELKMNARILQEKLETFKIVIENLSVTPGPVVTLYEFVPAPGIKISKIESLADDLAMALKARGIRIIAPIPGKGTVGIEIPNQNPSLVTFSNVITSARFANAQQRLPIALGKTISGEVFIADLAKMPHLLIAGSTGSGKSVGINTVITSLLYKKHPKELKFVIIDPKKVELQHYSLLAKHFIAISPEIKDTIITNPNDAVTALKAAVIEMERRYDILASAGQRNIHEYNRKVAEGKIREDKAIDHKQMPYIVIVIDELADLMLTASKEIEEPIIRLAQMARAVGIHLVIATQRPSVDVITGIIKANFPARIAYLVASKIDSRTILDTGGAEQLLGNGDMLFLPSGSPKPIRIQNSYLGNDEVEEICGFIGNQKGYSQPYTLPRVNEDTGGVEDIDLSDRDPLFEDAARLVIQHQQGSVSLIQRRLKVGYARAGRIVDELEAAGVVGPFEGSKTRTVLMESESELEAIL